MFNVSFDYSDISDFQRELDRGTFDIAVEKALKTYLSKVYADLAKQHGRRYTYETPPANRRSNLRMRTRGLLNELRDARFITKNGDTITGGFKIRKGSILWTHEGSEDPEDTIIYPSSGEYLTIPLKAAMASDGSTKRITARTFSQMRKFLIVDHIQPREKHEKSGSKIIPITVDQLKAPGENLFKLRKSLILGIRRGRKIVPYFILAREVHIPKRIFIQASLEKFEEEFFNQLDKQVERMLSRI